MKRSFKEKYLQPFLGISGNDTYEEIYAKFKRFKDMGIDSAVLQYHSGHSFSVIDSPFDKVYFDTLRRMSQVCRELDMTYWIQDAAPFPTGSGNGSFEKEEFKNHGKIHIIERHMTVEGPVENGLIYTDRLMKTSKKNMFVEMVESKGEPDPVIRVIGAVAMKMNVTDEGVTFDWNSSIDLGNGLDPENCTLRFDLPSGYYRIFLICTTTKGGRKGYMNLIDPESIRIEIESVHELHYSELKDEIGKTFEGFFYDEPEVGNAPGYDFDNLPGRGADSLPWSFEMAGYMEERLGKDWITYIPALWSDCDEITHIARFHYMDIVTRLIAENYNGQVEKWCDERGIRYIGHVLEDENSHGRLGCGPGHFFRMQKHQHMAGIDCIAGQIYPGIDVPGTNWYSTPEGDSEFYFYGMAKLAASEGFINPDKDGKSFCEAGAVYGDSLSPKMYKWLMDYLFVNGINNLVPAFGQSFEIDEGNKIFTYAKEMCSLLEGSFHRAPAAVLYHAESEWSGKAMLFQKCAKELLTKQIDYTLVPGDAIVEKDFYQTKLENGLLKIGREEFSCIIIPYCQYIRRDVLLSLIKLKKDGFNVIFANEAPEGCCEDNAALPEGTDLIPAIPLSDLAAELDSIRDIKTSGYEHFLHYHHFIKDGEHYYFFLNGDMRTTIDTEVTFLNENRTMKIRLMPLESLLVKMSDICQKESHEVLDINEWTVSIEGFEEKRVIKELIDIGSDDKLVYFSGRIIYEGQFHIDDPSSATAIDLGEVCDGAEVRINGNDLGLTVYAPYRLPVNDALTEGMNTVRIEVRVSPERKPMDANGFRAFFVGTSTPTYMVKTKMGLFGPLSLIRKES